MHDEEWMEVMQWYEKDTYYTYLTEEELWRNLIKDSLDAKISTMSSPVGMPLDMSQEAVLIRDRDISSRASFVQTKPHQKHEEYNFASSPSHFHCPISRPVKSE